MPRVRPNGESDGATKKEKSEAVAAIRSILREPVDVSDTLGPAPPSGGEPLSESRYASQFVQGKGMVRIPFGDTFLARPDLQHLALAAIGKGLPMEMVAGAIGVSFRTLQSWFERGRGEIVVTEDGDRYATGPWGEFVLKAQKLQAMIVLKRLDKIEAIGERRSEWTAFAWLLERNYPELFGRVNRDSGQQGPQASPTVNVIYVNDWRNNAQLQQAFQEGQVIEAEVVKAIEGAPTGPPPGESVDAPEG